MLAIHFSTCSSFDRGEICRMRSFGKIPRGGKRGGTSTSSSSSTLCFSWASTAAMVIFVAFCVYGVYTLTSSSPSSLLSSSHSSRKDGQPFLEEPPADDVSINEENLHGSGRYEPGSGVSDQEYSRNQKRLEDRGAIEEEEEKEENNSSKEQNQMEKARENDSPINSQVEEQSEGSGDDRSWENQAIHSRNEYEWDLCNVTAGPDYIPCLDNTNAVKKLKSLKHFEHRERHCPDESPTCVVPLPYGYKRSIEWPTSRDKVWYSNVPRTKLAEVKGHQNWVKVEGDYLTFPGGGTQFIHGALHYIDFIKQSRRDIGWGKHTRVILDVGCGVASFGGYLFERDVLAMSFAPKDEHEAQIQFALERGIPAISAVMGSQRLPFPSNAFDLIHCARCRVPWHADAGMLLLELNRLLRPGGYFVWSATPVYQKLKEDVGIWKAMTSLTKSMCWDLATVKKDRLNGVAAAFYRKPASNECYDSRNNNETPPMCEDGDDPNRAWYTPLKSCMHRVPERGAKWPAEWPRRLSAPPNWLNPSSALDFRADSERWKNTVMNCYLSGELGFNWTGVRNAMDMRSVYGGFAAALRDDLKIWVVNVVNVDSGDDTLPIIYERGLFGIYHDWCESFSTYPRTYDLLHADRLFSKLKVRCSIVPVMAEIDRIVRPGGKLIVRDESAVAGEVEALLKSLHWEVKMLIGRDGEGIIAAQKSDWRPNNHSASS